MKHSTLIILGGYPQNIEHYFHEDTFRGFDIVYHDWLKNEDNGDPVTEAVRYIQRFSNTHPHRRLVILGHDLGGLVCWKLAELEHFDGMLVSLAMPHPGIMYYETVYAKIAQSMRSSYVLATCAIATHRLLAIPRIQKILAKRLIKTGFPESDVKGSFAQFGSKYYRENVAYTYRKIVAQSIKNNPINLHQPVHIICPRNDTFVSYGTYAAHENIPSVTLHHDTTLTHWADEDFARFVHSTLLEVSKLIVTHSRYEEL